MSGSLTFSLPALAGLQGHGHALYLCEAVEHGFERELATDPALLVAAIGQARELAEPPIYLDPTGLDRVRRSQRLGDVMAPDVGAEPVVAVVRHPDRVLLALPGDDHEHRSEDLFPRYPPVVADVREDGRLQKVAFGERAGRGRQPTQHELGP